MMAIFLTILAGLTLGVAVTRGSVTTVATG